MLDDLLRQDSYLEDEDDFGVELDDPQTNDPAADQAAGGGGGAADKPPASAGRPSSQRAGAGAAPKQAAARTNGSGGEGGTRYFIMKSLNHENITQSIERGIWATQPHNEAKLNEAYASAASVVLFFSVNTSGCFQGYAHMTSPVLRQQVGLACFCC